MYMRIWLRTAIASAVNSPAISYSAKNAATGDGILTSLKVMEVILEKKQTLGKLATEIQIYPQVLKNVKVKE